MKRVVAVLACTIFGIAAALAQTSSPISVEQAWARATPLGARTGAVYMTLVNHSPTDDQLVGASTPVASLAQVHEMSMADGVMKMRHIASLELKPGATVALMPGGYHLMLIDLKRPLKEGETFPLTLTFAKSSPRQIEVKVAKIGAMQPDTGINAGAMPGMDMPK